MHKYRPRLLEALLFIPKAERTNAWMSFPSLEELSVAVTRAIRQVNKSGIFDGLIKLFR